MCFHGIITFDFPDISVGFVHGPMTRQNIYNFFVLLAYSIPTPSPHNKKRLEIGLFNRKKEFLKKHFFLQRLPINISNKTQITTKRNKKFYT